MATLQGSQDPGSSSDQKAAEAEKLPENQNTKDTSGIDADGLVWWDGEDDPENPYNWPRWRKNTNGALISLVTFITPLASSIFAPAVPLLMADFKSSDTELAAFVVSVYVLGFAFGPMVLAPLSEMYGRVPVYHVCNACFVAFTAGCALAPSLGSLVAFRFLAGCFGSAPLTNGGGSIADIFPQEKRGAVMAAFSVGPLLGPIIGPVVGGFLSDEKGWRWVFWVVAIVSGAISIAMLFTMRESYAPIILAQKAARLRKETGNESLRSKLDLDCSRPELFKRSIVRPMKLLLFSPICTVFALFMAVLYGYLYLLFTSVPYVFSKSYNFSGSTSGLVYLGLGVGSFMGMTWFAVDSAREIKKHMGEEGGNAKPEIRLKLLPTGSIILPIGFFIYGWTTDYETHWMGPIIGLGIIGVGNLICFMAVSVYLVDAYERYAASALAANTIIRSIAGCVLPIFGLRMYDALGLGWGNTMLGLVAVLLIPIPFLIVRFGERLRKKFKMEDL
ncbi:major facilitator superfamily domain-containing protein [Dactylonectria macrodidyma]|uniref:Major facilitator superfamily domain-containing protein n=1 Tax=Dactylonectria macrodidyma TaxID=307937 RepID=A0A9P9EDQ4_9HYPO|nr:major facilitator superfamily domain-containing protein [Dactylonectria macrodidyma]